MRTIKSPEKIGRISREFSKRGMKVGLVPTMGALHDGHMSLVHAARKENDAVVVSIFVNPMQFGPGEDFKRYPRTLERDLSMCRDAGVDYIFNPEAGEFTPPEYSTFVEVEGPTAGLCGRSRPGHFRGVTTIVTKLFNLVSPSSAYFGQKDLQQAMVITKMAKELDTGIRIRVMPIIRELDGLALSSRNRYLSRGERARALALSNGLEEARKLYLTGERRSKILLGSTRKTINRMLDIKTDRVDYISLVSLPGLEEAPSAHGACAIAVSVFIGRTRLIDNIILMEGEEA